jgi:hypothetical protein
MLSLKEVISDSQRCFPLRQRPVKTTRKPVDWCSTCIGSTSADHNSLCVASNSVRLGGWVPSQRFCSSYTADRVGDTLVSTSLARSMAALSGAALSGYSGPVPIPSCYVLFHSVDFRVVHLGSLEAASDCVSSTEVMSHLPASTDWFCSSPVGLWFRLLEILHFTHGHFRHLLLRKAYGCRSLLFGSRCFRPLPAQLEPPSQHACVWYQLGPAGISLARIFRTTPPKIVVLYGNKAGRPAWNPAKP